MGQILIRNLDDAVIAAWKRRAAANGRSLQAELHAELSRSVAAQEREEAMARLARIRASADMSKMDKQGWELIREDRDSR